MRRVFSLRSSVPRNRLYSRGDRMAAGFSASSFIKLSVRVQLRDDVGGDP